MSLSSFSGLLCPKLVLDSDLRVLLIMDRYLDCSGKLLCVFSEVLTR